MKMKMVIGLLAAAAAVPYVALVLVGTACLVGGGFTSWVEWAVYLSACFAAGMVSHALLPKCSR